jgi:hypothetical protein
LLNYAIGIDYKPSKYLSVFISPINSRMIYMSDTSLSALNSLKPDQKFNYELGMIAKVYYEKEIRKNINVMSKLDLFADYRHLDCFKCIDMNWEVLLNIKLFKAVSININTNLLWDNDIKTVNKDGLLGDPKLQIKEIFGAGLAFNL